MLHLEGKEPEQVTNSHLFFSGTAAEWWTNQRFVIAATSLIFHLTYKHAIILCVPIHQWMVSSACMLRLMLTSAAWQTSLWETGGQRPTAVRSWQLHKDSDTENNTADILVGFYRIDPQRDCSSRDRTVCPITERSKFKVHHIQGCLCVLGQNTEPIESDWMLAGSGRGHLRPILCSLYINLPAIGLLGIHTSLTNTCMNVIWMSNGFENTVQFNYININDIKWSDTALLFF